LPVFVVSPVSRLLQPKAAASNKSTAIEVRIPVLVTWNAMSAMGRKLPLTLTT
jgi:hypothetical protein